MNIFFKKGITIIEILIVISIIGLIAAIVFPQFYKIREQQVLASATSEIMSSLDRAKSQTLASFNSSEYGVHFQSDKVIIFKGKTFTPGFIGNENINIVTPATISNVTLGGINASTGDLYFNRLSGAPNQTVTITISTFSYTKTITISATGTASID